MKKLLILCLYLVIIHMLMAGSAKAFDGIVTTKGHKTFADTEAYEKQRLEQKIELLHREILVLKARFDESKTKYISESKLIEHTSQVALSYQKSMQELEEGIDELDEEVKQASLLTSKLIIQSDHSDVSSTVLAAATLVITGLSISIAILAIWGYRNIKKGAVDEALKQSEQQVIDAIANGEFNATIYLAVEKAIYRDILSTDDFPDVDGEDDESM